MAGGEWNAQRLKRLLESDVERITAAAVRDGKVADAAAFAAALVESLKAGDSLSINVKVVHASGEEVFFKIKKNTHLSKIKNAIGQRQGVNPQGLRLVFNGERVPSLGSETPEECGMEDGDVIDALQEQMGD